MPPRFQKQAAEYMRQQTQQPAPPASNQAPHFMRSQSQTSPGPTSVGNPHIGPVQLPVPMPGGYDQGWPGHSPYMNQMAGKIFLLSCVIGCFYVFL